MREPMQQRKIGSLKLELKRKITHEKKKKKFFVI